MLANLINVAPAALRNPFGGPVSGVRSIQPVVHRAAARPQAEATRYTPKPAQILDEETYSSKGRLNIAGAAYQTVSVDRDESFDLTIKTAQGDLATISITQKQGFSAAGGMQWGGQDLALALEADSSESLNVQIAVNGEFDAQEMASIRGLVNQVDDVAADFFAGDMKQALAGAAGIDISGQADTLSAFSFELQSQEVRRAVSLYEDVAAATSPQKATTPWLQGPLATPAASNSNFLRDLVALFDDLTHRAQDLLPPLVSATDGEATLTQPTV